MDNKKENIYDASIDTSMQASLLKALEILEKEQEKNRPQITRPDINPKKGFVKIAVVIFILLALCLLFHFFDISHWFVLIPIFVIVILTAKKFILWLVLLYQKYAPEKLRASCVFTPTCSDYMILAITKYGLCKGLLRGIGRLSRCHPPNGGPDNP